MSKKIYLSPSDQVRNLYAYGNTNEAAQCRKIAAACKVALERCGFEVKTNYKDGSNAMYERVAESNNWGADLHVCIHTNAFNGKVSGTRLMAYDTSGKGYKACKAIFNALAPITPGKSENISAYPGLYEIRKVNAPTAYIECEFHDVPSVAKWIVEHTTKIGEAIAKGICNYFGIAYKSPAPAHKPTTTPTSDKLYRVQVGAFKVKANAEAMLAKLKAAGFDGYIKQE